jgi:uncharacterized membrane protein
MEELIKNLSGYIAFFMEVTAIILISMGGIRALIRLCFSLANLDEQWKKQVWQDFALWLMLGLEFMLAGDIIKTAIAPTWNQLGQLALIAFIRTFLNYFLEKDLSKTASIKNLRDNYGQEYGSKF